MLLLRNTSPMFFGAMLGLVLGILTSAMMPAVAHADAPLSSATNQYVDMCMKATDIPAPYGEGDLKENPRLGDYCKCFGARFAARAIASVASMQGLGKASSAQEDPEKEEQAMRNDCRKQVGLPLIQFKP
ncbi:hypothetical protein FHW69_003062 [Luteibacter sp. Sphag1AF]|uniref:hypothetical protein n=1 Tax=Luteibacter sp. Sphag1AF TaxID=2587031 RepID=UPI00162151A9|nr:hypothetical protein [Luteibacter sp. Sphag1AF]MBB3228427.1 hypothetical protein [Luteibacter sp. Sphag1AF]